MWRQVIYPIELSILHKTANFLIKETKSQFEELNQQHHVLKQKDTDIEDTVDWLAEEAYGIETFKQVMYSSFILSIFALIEEYLFKLCDHWQVKTNQTFSVTDLGGFGIKATLNYLDRVLPENFMKNDPDILHFHRLRNHLAHGNKKLSDEKMNILIKKLKATSFQCSAHNNKLNFNDNDLFEYLKFAEKVFKEISNQWIVTS